MLTVLHICLRGQWKGTTLEGGRTLHSEGTRQKKDMSSWVTCIALPH
jgi:hypothetical protein